jgi:hypothetical protein
MVQPATQTVCFVIDRPDADAGLATPHARGDSPVREEQQRSAPSMSRTRAVVKTVVRCADAPLTPADIRHLAQRHDPSLNGVMVAIAVADLRSEGKIRVKS